MISLHNYDLPSYLPLSHVLSQYLPNSAWLGWFFSNSAPHLSTMSSQDLINIAWAVGVWNKEAARKMARENLITGADGKNLTKLMRVSPSQEKREERSGVKLAPGESKRIVVRDGGTPLGRRGKSKGSASSLILPPSLVWTASECEFIQELLQSTSTSSSSSSSVFLPKNMSDIGLTRVKSSPPPPSTLLSGPSPLPAYIFDLKNKAAKDDSGQQCSNSNTSSFVSDSQVTSSPVPPSWWAIMFLAQAEERIIKTALATCWKGGQRHSSALLRGRGKRNLTAWHLTSRSLSVLCWVLHKLQLRPSRYERSCEIVWMI
jgi:hypothetical protein